MVLICILGGLSVSTFSANFHFCLNYLLFQSHNLYVMFIYLKIIDIICSPSRWSKNKISKRLSSLQVTFHAEQKVYYLTITSYTHIVIVKKFSFLFLFPMAPDV